MAAKKAARQKQEDGMLHSIGGRDEVSPKPGAGISIGWMGYVGGALWATVICAAGLVAWLVFGGGA